MGPRPFGRGMIVTVDDSSESRVLQWGRDLSVAECPRRPRGRRRRRASMGPRPFGRGMPSPRSGRPSSARSFNGAATFRSRNVGATRSSCERIRRFNGAATFRSRNARARALCQARRSASMGPRPFGRGMRFSSPDLSLSRLLQWGRDLSVAECRRRCLCTARSTSFNGAATFRSRNGTGRGSARPTT